jgi:redox-sensitive bicupin YhaK (pirin superfamily)
MNLVHAATTSVPRPISHRTRGSGHGPITRLMSPGDLGNVLKPFVFLDRIDADTSGFPPMDFGWHPHSGIATVTVILDGVARFAETTGRSGTLGPGSVEWMRAGGGVWHTGGAEPGRVRGFQLWVALPPELENGESASFYASPDVVPVAGPARVVLGHYDAAQSPIDAPPMTYLSVELQAGERWTFRPPVGHELAWVALMDGAVRTPSPVHAGELAVFARGEGAIDFEATEHTRFVLGSAAPHPHELVLGHYSVHTSRDALRRGETEIRRLGRALLAAGKQSYALRTMV